MAFVKLPILTRKYSYSSEEGTWVCPDCGSEDVQELLELWVSVNDPGDTDVYEGSPVRRNETLYCPDCDSPFKSEFVRP